jgi:hypothetical protein
MIFTENINATYFISFDIPMRQMHAAGEVNFAAISQKKAGLAGAEGWMTWAKLHKPRTVVLTRYGQPDGIEIIRHFKHLGVPVIYHIDDDLLEIPESLGSEIGARQGVPEVIEARRMMMEQCDLIYTSTAYLAELMRTRFPRQEIYHGMYAPYMRPLAWAIRCWATWARADTHMTLQW